VRIATALFLVALLTTVFFANTDAIAGIPQPPKPVPPAIYAAGIPQPPKPVPPAIFAGIPQPPKPVPPTASA